MELKNKCDAIEKREVEKRQLEEKKHQEELQALKKTNQQLKVQHVLQSGYHPGSLLLARSCETFVVVPPPCTWE